MDTGWDTKINGVMAPTEGAACPNCTSIHVKLDQFIYISPTCVFDRRVCLSCRHGWERRWNLVTRSCKIKASG